MRLPKYLDGQPGIAIGPILFIVGILGVITMALSSGTGSFGASTVSDRIKADVRGQTNLIRAKIQECYMATLGNASFDYPAGPTPNGTLVKNVTCPGDPTGSQNLWTGARPTALPPTPQGFSDWVYFNYASGRCLKLVPNGGATSAAPVKSGLSTVAGYFGPNEVYLNTTGDYSLSIWLTPLATTKVCGS